MSEESQVDSKVYSKSTIFSVKVFTKRIFSLTSDLDCRWQQGEQPPGRKHYHPAKKVKCHYAQFNFET